MEACRSETIPRNRAVSYLGPIYVRTNCVELPVSGASKDSAESYTESLDISKYKINKEPLTNRPSDAYNQHTHVNNRDKGETTRQLRAELDTPVSVVSEVKSLENIEPDTFYRVNGGYELIVHGKGEPPTCDVGKRSNALQAAEFHDERIDVNGRSVDVDDEVDEALDDLDRAIMSEKSTGRGGADCSFKISSTEDNYMWNRHMSRQTKTPEATDSVLKNTSEISDPPIVTDIQGRNGKLRESDSSKKAMQSLTKHMSRIAKLKRRFFEGSPPKSRARLETPDKNAAKVNTETDSPCQSQTPSSTNINDGSYRQPPSESASVDKTKTGSDNGVNGINYDDDVNTEKDERVDTDKAADYLKTKPCKPGQYATESRAALMRASGRKYKNKHRRHSSEGILGRADLFEDSMRWSAANLSDVATNYLAVVAIDFGTAYSGYAYCFTHDPDTVHVMRRQDGGDPGVYNQKIPTTILLTPEGAFHSFGYAARDFFNDLDPKDAVRWMYCERFKMLLHEEEILSKDTEIRAQNGIKVSALKVFAYSLAFFKKLVLQELSDQSGFQLSSESIRWVLTVPAIWKASAKQFMRLSAYEAGIVPPDRPDQLLIALEPEAASIYCRRLRMLRYLSITGDGTSDTPRSSASMPDLSANVSITSNDIEVGTRYMIVDCGGGTVDITVHELLEGGRLRELHRATGGAHGSLGVDEEFEGLVCRIFGKDIVQQFRRKRPAGWVELMVMFESRKRTASPFRESHISVSIPFAFIDFYKKCRGHSVESAVKKYGDPEVSWTSNGQLRLTPSAMRRLFLPTISAMKQAIGLVLNHPNIKGLMYMFLVGGFAESSIVQHEMRTDFGAILKVIIPAGVGMTILKGAVGFGIDPCVVKERCVCETYGVGVLHRFDPRQHPADKLITKDGLDWCTDIFDVFVRVDQSVALGDGIVRRYTPVRRDQTTTTINIYSTDRADVRFITDDGVKKCGTLSLTFPDVPDGNRREIRTTMCFGDTEIKATAMDVKSGHYVEAFIDFIST